MSPFRLLVTILLVFGCSPQPYAAAQSGTYGDVFLALDDEIVVPREDLGADRPIRPSYVAACASERKPLIMIRLGRRPQQGTDERIPISFTFDGEETIRVRVRTSEDRDTAYLPDDELRWIGAASSSESVYIQVGEPGSETAHRPLRGFPRAVRQLSCVDAATLALLPYPPAVRVACPSGVETITKKMPRFPGGMNALQQRIRYPGVARREAIEGRVIVQFIVGTEGQILDPRVTRGVHASLDAEALRVVRSAIVVPGRDHEGVAACVKMSLPITFRLPGSAP